MTLLRTHTKLIGFFVVMAVLLAVAVQAYLESLPPSSVSKPVLVHIQPGMSSSQIANVLYLKGVIKSPLLFQFAVIFEGASKKLRAGTYLLNKDMSLSSIVATLVKGVASYEVVTIPEGFTAQQIAMRLAKLSVASASSYMYYVQHFNWSMKTVYGIPKNQSLEGFLYPDTYYVPKGYGAKNFLELQLKTFNQKAKSKVLLGAKLHSVTPYDIVILASVVQREAKFAQDFPKVCSVFYNRLKLGMPLQADATVLYALHRTSGSITSKDLQVNSPYNTYLHTGLPPGPISNPGLLAISACVHPANTDYLYYVSSPSGKIYYSRTLAGHLRQIQQIYGR